jgi:hypothetical protein
MPKKIQQLLNSMEPNGWGANFGSIKLNHEKVVVAVAVAVIDEEIGQGNRKLMNNGT